MRYCSTTFRITIYRKLILFIFVHHRKNLLGFVLNELKKLSTSVVVLTTDWVEKWTSLSVFVAIKGTFDEILVIDDFLEPGSVGFLYENKI